MREWIKEVDGRRGEARGDGGGRRLKRMKK